jgi:hypothetical protein
VGRKKIPQREGSALSRKIRGEKKENSNNNEDNKKHNFENNKNKKNNNIDFDKMRNMFEGMKGGRE